MKRWGIEKDSKSTEVILELSHLFYTDKYILSQDSWLKMTWNVTVKICLLA